jgi:hypothetical protein
MIQLSYTNFSIDQESNSLSEELRKIVRFLDIIRPYTPFFLIKEMLCFIQEEKWEKVKVFTQRARHARE